MLTSGVAEINLILGPAEVADYALKTAIAAGVIFAFVYVGTFIYTFVRVESGQMSYEQIRLAQAKKLGPGFWLARGPRPRAPARPRRGISLNW